MKRMFYLMFLFLLVTGSFFLKEYKEEAIYRVENNFNNNWKFKKEGETAWQNISIPHTTQIEPLVVNDQWQGISWYQKKFDLQTNQDQKVFLEFEGVMHEADVWLNEKLLTTHKGGYLPFCLDLTDYLNNGANTLKLRVDNKDNSAIPPGKPLKGLDFNYYGGVYRDVKLIETNRIHITNAILENKPASGGLLVHFSEVSTSSAKGSVKVHVVNETDKDADLKLKILLTDTEGNLVEHSSDASLIEPNGNREVMINFQVENPQLWSPQTPNLYDLKIALYANGQKVDQVEQKTGIRKIELTEDGFYLNNEKIYIRGTNRHQEYPYVGYAISDNAHYRDAVKIKQAGFDLVRLSHYPQDDAFLDACDELGILVMNAIPGWQFYGDQEFVNNSYQDIRNMVRKDRNHPSVVFWEVSLNESGMTEEYMINANKILKEELPFEDTYSAGWIDHPAFDLYIPARQHGKAPDYWTKYNKEGRQVFIAEYGDWEYYAQNAGFNQKAFEDLKEEERTSRQLREHGEKRLLQQALNFQEAANSNRFGKHTIGHANWVMFDYNRGYANDLEASGIADIFRIPKFAYYFYQSQRPPSEVINFRDAKIGGPMVKIASHWNEYSPIELRIYSNCDEVQLFLNDSLIERKGIQSNVYSTHLDHPPFVFNLEKFEPGQLKALGLIAGKVVATDLVQTPLEVDQIKVFADLSHLPLTAEKGDVVIVHAVVIDKNGVVLPADSSLVRFELNSGNATLIGQNPVKARAGIASILLKTNDLEKNILISAQSENRKSATLVLGLN